MKKANAVTGDIIQIPLPASLGFAYAKFIDLGKMRPGSSYPHMVRIYRIRLETELSDLQKLSHTDLILAPHLIGGLPVAIRTGRWKVVGNLPTGKQEMEIPHYKTAEPDEDNPLQWYYVVDADISTRTPCEPNTVAHLEPLGAVGSEIVAVKIAMALLRDEGKKIEDHFALTDYFERAFYKEVMSVQPFYKQPLEMRARARKK